MTQPTGDAGQATGDAVQPTGDVGQGPVDETSAPLAAFDFDGTLTRGDCLFPFLCRLLGGRRVAAACGRHAVPLGLAAAGRYDRDLAKAVLLARLLTGVTLARVETVAEDGAPGLFRRLRPASVERLRWHQAERHEVVVVTASPDAVVAPVARRLGIDVVLGTRLEVDADGRLTGRLQGANNRGDEKVRRLQAHLAATAAVGAPARELWAYGDSAGDDALLASADHPFRVIGADIVPVDVRVLTAPSRTWLRGRPRGT